MAIKEARQQHPDMLVTKAVVVRETESSTQDPNEESKVFVAGPRVHNRFQNAHSFFPSIFIPHVNDLFVYFCISPDLLSVIREDVSQ